MKQALALVAAIWLAGCASQSANANGKVPDPAVTLEQTSSMPLAAEHITGGMPVGLRMSVTNRAGIPITLQRAELRSLGSGAYNIANFQRSFGKTIEPGATEVFEFWVNADAAESVAGNNGAVAIRVTTVYNSKDGGFRNVVVSQVGAYGRR